MEQILKLSFIFGLFALFRKVHGDLQSNVSNPDAFPDNRFESNNTTITVNESLGTKDLTIDQLRALCMRMPSQSQLWSTICEGILSVIVGVFGLIGNVATIFVLTRPTFRETFHKLLICLACFDSLFILSALMIYAIRAHALHLTGTSIIHFCFLALYPMGNLALYGSTYLTLAVSIERFLGLVYPVQSRTRPRRQLCTYLIPVLGFSILFNIPKALEFRLFNVLDDKNNTSIEVGESEWARDKYYNQYYKVWSNLILTAVIPLAVLIFCNMAIFIVLRKNSKAMVEARQKSKPNHIVLNKQAHNQSTISNTSNTVSTSSHSNDNSLALILAGIVLVFIVCHGCRFFLAFYQVSVVKRTDECIEHGLQSPQPEWLYRISALNHLMLMVNSSVNFIIYCAVGSRFRRALAHALFGLFCRKLNSSQRSNGWVQPLHSNMNNSSDNNKNKISSFVIQKRGHFILRGRIPKGPDVEVRLSSEAVPLDSRPVLESNLSDSNPDAICVGIIGQNANEESPKVNKDTSTLMHNGILCSRNPKSQDDEDSNDDEDEQSKQKWVKVTAEINRESVTGRRATYNFEPKAFGKNKKTSENSHFLTDSIEDQTCSSSNF